MKLRLILLLCLTWPLIGERGKTVSAENTAPVHKTFVVAYQPKASSRVLDRDKFIQGLRKFSSYYKEDLPEERGGMAYFKGNTRCITCHNSLYIKRTNRYISKLMDFNRGKIRHDETDKSESDFIKTGQTFTPEKKSGEFKLPEKIRLMEYLRDETDIRLEQMSTIPSA